jgi:hypothetical protein
VADAWNLFEFACTGQCLQILIEAAERTGCALLRQRTEAIFTLEGEHPRHPVENFCDLFVHHLGK